ncbi:MAG: hypothetical protein A2312_01105 [Candidatus Staskawiczbacteria bacterium RIFOXYB2_FULL_32_9]|uniref:Transcriptional repressor PaaX-like central Cas2-like domain-containing protein n=1 Tax=Candidatus Staskawiczbacteria bacterium RIFOXYD1_FULL_32_13 TaxID=1802234 RepID=A0A1G2JNC4_9BACT|nr:MAG: PaaX domain protein [Parcubacteria group bacterium GW2011_GWC2_32_10]OGZ80554.1 MAG: hypothetical protein A2256_04295 [Candidatus Staskawiczbacteria bacterium RIFOXYA2_FULL_32_7]OGZ80992.1 MAG: hypothetical protein A2360_02230 [Candidatus Staskawiczbacteria bacterium RIFOXYB1_FULL_32_11]OGZ82780.1 MAG: hypothetical protein A2312_01105 [Candidatus Staskawiczbacteria bacterium RIFOXYB2_FULL_32_9]OGZ85163.1 MAG: hypothetical protein A2463_00605 [Candidatus Staskawiczbacteria bacterium RIFO
MKSKLTIKIIEYLFLFGVISIVATSPYFLYNLMKLMLKSSSYSKDEINKFRNAFNYAKKNGLILIEKDGYDVKITITEKGEARMKKFRIANLNINKPKVWDKKIRVVIFDIPNSQRIKRNAFRGKLKELGFYSTQKSVWLHPYECKDQIKILMDFFGLTNKQIQIFVADKIEDDILLEKIKSVYKI